MTITIVKGLAEATQRPQQQQNVAKVAAKQASDGGRVARGVTTEAAQTSLNHVRNSANTDKIRDYKEAKDLSYKVADDIREDEAGAEVHENLNPTSAREHFA